MQEAKNSSGMNLRSTRWSILSTSKSGKNSATTNLREPWKLHMSELMFSDSNIPKIKLAPYFITKMSIRCRPFRVIIIIHGTWSSTRKTSNITPKIWTNWTKPHQSSNKRKSWAPLTTRTVRNSRKRFHILRTIPNNTIPCPQISINNLNKNKRRNFLRQRVRTRWNLTK